MKKTVFAALAVVLLTSFNAQALETSASHALLMDADTGYVMFSKKADVPMPPASMSKLMTAYMVFDALKSGRISLEDDFEVSERAWRIGGAKSGSSTMFLKPKQKVKVKDLLRGIIVQSGNDACITVAENLAGSEEIFAAQMTQTARRLGLKNASFKNATGLPDREHRMSAHDLADLAQILIREFPEYYGIYSEREFKYNGIRQGNRNPLLYTVKGADGLKTGHTKESGYGLTASVKTQDGRRLIMVLNGLKSMKDRASESQKLVAYGISGFENKIVFEKDQETVSVPVWLGVDKEVAAVSPEKIVVTLPRDVSPKEIKTTVSYDTPLKAPVQKGDKIASLKLEVPGQETKTFALTAAKDVAKTGYFGKLKAVVSSWFEMGL